MAMRLEEALEIFGLSHNDASVSPGADPALLRGVQRKLSLRQHPDRGGGHEEWLRFTEAQNVLCATRDGRRAFRMDSETRAWMMEFVASVWSAFAGGNERGGPIGARSDEPKERREDVAVVRMGRDEFEEGAVYRFTQPVKRSMVAEGAEETGVWVEQTIEVPLVEGSVVVKGVGDDGGDLRITFEVVE